jgi:7-cyano-7-deazaguanine synthase
MDQKKAIVILSGGLDSTTCMGMAQLKGFEIYPITFDYGQRHRHEIINARKVAEHYGVGDRHRIIPLDFLKSFGGSALTDESIAVPKVKNPTLKLHGENSANKSTNNEVIQLSEARGYAGTGWDGQCGADSDIPVTYVPGRNLLFLSIATSYAEVTGAEAIYIGVNALDYSGYPDCRPEFIAKVEEVIALATKVGVEGKRVRIETPLIHMTKAEIIQAGTALQVPYHLTTSCYNGEELACGECDSCSLRLKGFAEAGIEDPIRYR